jgi:hypothetical protein
MGRAGTMNYEDINFVCEELKDKHRDLKYVRNKSENGLITPLISEIVFKLNIR